jgi:hypothetical protein
MRFVINLFWGIVGLAFLLAVLYAVTRFLRARGGVFGKIGSVVENATQP